MLEESIGGWEGPYDPLKRGDGEYGTRHRHCRERLDEFAHTRENITDRVSCNESLELLALVLLKFEPDADRLIDFRLGQKITPTA